MCKWLEQSEVGSIAELLLIYKARITRYCNTTGRPNNFWLRLIVNCLVAKTCWDILYEPNEVMYLYCSAPKVGYVCRRLLDLKRSPKSSFLQTYNSPPPFSGGNGCFQTCTCNAENKYESKETYNKGLANLVLYTKMSRMR